MLAQTPGMDIVGQAANAHEGYALFCALKPDAIVLDVRMPGESGIKLLEKVKRESPDTVVVMLTSYPASSYRTHCEMLGADGFLDKATDFEKLVEVLRGPRDSSISAETAVNAFDWEKDSWKSPRIL